ncbi:hypothetical protein VaNZ11_007004 [Volvox africanus]|uniref:DNA ligase n=1 Tax=Volvox africanus TaxID=51714 RepID=A0ABQ5S1Y0_9CHLO|nr:hypothetical protein VaNZ11_007004 [Volvox africanus]
MPMEAARLPPAQRDLIIVPSHAAMSLGGHSRLAKAIHEVRTPTAPAGRSGGKPATAGKISFQTFTKLVQTLVGTPQKNGKKVKVLRRFCDQHVPRMDGNDLFHFYRLLLPGPQAEKERGNYQLKEAKMVAVLAGAVGASAADIERAKQWRSLNSTRSGIFHEVMYEVLFRKYLRDPQQTDPQPSPLTLEEVNAMLDELVRRAGDSGYQQALLRALLQRCTPEAARVLVLIIMKDLRIGMSADTVLSAYHPDAPDLFNGCMDLRKVLTDLLDPNTRVKKKDVVPGQPAKPQLADRCDGGVVVAAKRMRGKRFVVEVKFDGERMQVHRAGPDSFNFFSRRGLDHGFKRDFTVLGPALASLMTQERMILDGEMVVWNKTRQVFEPFGGLSSAMDAINRGAAPSERMKMKMGTSINTSDPDYVFPTAADVEVIFVAFDVLYIDDSSVLDKPLGERHQLLRRALRSCPPEGIPVGAAGVIRFRALPLLPGAIMLGGEVYSKEGTGDEDIKDMYERALAKQEEGIVVKALDSPYKLNDRSGSWLKVKPDYVDSSEFDTVIIGAAWGTGGRRGGRLSEYLLALADTPRLPGAEPSTFVSFCRVGSGLSAEQADLVRELLRPLLVELAPGQRPPRCYRLTGQARERPDVWVRDPLRSVVLTVKADVRTIVSDTFASRYSLRFPRVVAVREDRSARDINTLAELERMVLERARVNQGQLEAGGALPAEAGSQAGGRGDREGGRTRRRVGGSGRGGPSRIAVAKVPLELRPVDVSHVDVEVDLLAGRYVLLRDLHPEQRRQLAALVKRLGGMETQNYVPSGPQATSYVILGRCDPPDRIRSNPFLEPMAARADLLRPEWLQVVAEQRALVDPPRPSLAWSISGQTRAKYSDVLDMYGDPYFEALGEEDLEAVLSRHITCDQLAAARRQLEEAAALPARTRRRARQLEARTHPEGRTSVYETADDVVRRIRDEIHDIGEKPPPGSIFLGLTLLFLEMHDIPPPPAPPPRSAVPLGLLTGVADCQARAHAAAARDPRDRVEALKAAVVRHGGVVVDAWDERVTHVVMYDGIDERDEQMRLMINAERVYSGLPELPAVAAGGGDGGAISAASKEYGPEEVIEALIGVTECPADEDAAAAAEEEEAEAGPLGIDGGIGDGGPLAARRRLSKEQSRSLSLIRAALERPRGAVEAVGPVQLVDWRWVRDSLQRVGDAAAAAAEAEAAAAARLAAADSLLGAEDAEDEEEFAEQAAAATVLGTLSELNYPPRILPPDKWLPQLQQAQMGAAAAAGTGTAAKVGLMAVALPESEGGRDMTLGGGGGGLAEVTVPPQQRQQRAAGGSDTTLGSIWRSVLDWESDEGDGGGIAAAASVHTTAAAVAGTERAATPVVANHDDTVTRSCVSPGHEAQTADGGAPKRMGPAAAGVARVSPPAPQAVAARVTLPPPEELIRLWPWERFHIDLPSPEELARLGTHQRRWHRRSDSNEVSTDGAMALNTGGGTAGGNTDVNRSSDGGMEGSTRGQAQSGEPPPSTANRRGKANHGGRRGVGGLQMPSQLPARRRKGRGKAAVGALVEDEQQLGVGDEVKGSRDAAGLSAVANSSSPTVVYKPPRRCAGREGKPLHGGVPGFGRKRAVEMVAATEQAREDGEDAKGAAKEMEAATRRQTKRPRRATAAAAAAAQSRDEEQVADTPLLYPIAGCQRSQSRRQLHVVNPDVGDEGSGFVEVPAGAMEPTKVLDGSDGGTAVSQRSQRGVGVSNSAPNERINVEAAFTGPSEPSHPTAREPGAEHAPRAATNATDAHASPRLTTTSGAEAPLLRKRRLNLIGAPYSYLARQPAPVDTDTGTSTTADAEAGSLGPEGLPTEREPSLRHGLGSGLRLLGSSKSDDNKRFSGRDGGNGKDLAQPPEPMAPVCPDGRVSRVEECGPGASLGAAVAAAPPLEDAGTFKAAGAGRAGDRGFMSDILSRILADNDEDI